MVSKGTRILLGCGITVVAALLLLNIYMALKPAPKPAINQPLVKLLPGKPEGWSSLDEDIANTPEEKEQAEQVLHFDDAVYRIYSNGRANVGVYVAHWNPGEFSPAKVGAHSPDTCWVHNGWDKLDGKDMVTQPTPDGTLKPMTTGTFEKDQQKVYVIFWHLVGGESVHYDLSGWENGLAGRIERLPILIADFRHFGLDQRKEQLVLRISSNVPFSELWDNPGFEKIMDGLGRTFDLYSPITPAANQAAKSASAGQPDEVRAL